MTELTSKELEPKDVIEPIEKVEPIKEQVKTSRVVEPIIIDGSKVVAVIEETPTATHYKLENGTTTWVEKIK